MKDLIRDSFTVELNESDFKIEPNLNHSSHDLNKNEFTHLYMHGEKILAYFHS